MFQFTKSKHSTEVYERWADLMSASVSAPIVAFVDSFWADKLVERFETNNRTGAHF